MQNEKKILESAVKILRRRATSEDFVAELLERIIKGDSRLTPEGALKISAAATNRHHQNRIKKLRPHEVKRAA